MPTCTILSPARRLAAGFVLDNDGCWRNASNINVLNMRDSVSRMGRADGPEQNHREARAFVAMVDAAYRTMPEIESSTEIRRLLSAIADAAEAGRDIARVVGEYFAGTDPSPRLTYEAWCQFGENVAPAPQRATCGGRE